jgi:hypothetical protein
VTLNETNTVKPTLLSIGHYFIFFYRIYKDSANGFYVSLYAFFLKKYIEKFIILPVGRMFII